VSDFDVSHLINANFVFQLPVGRGKAFMSGIGRLADTVIGGWQLSGVYRWNTGLPISAPFDQAQWATNWNVQSNGTIISPVKFGVNRNTQNVFTDPQAAFNSFRNARPGESGARNAFRGPSFQTLDLGLNKKVTMPWSETQILELRWEVFNVLNYQAFSPGNVTRTTYGLPQDPETGTAASTFGQLYNGIQGSPRSMQFGLRFSF